jgi:cyclopropane fatty-acyl-phospholipid synthase-like methyltransferase
LCVLQEEFPGARITASDVDQAAVDFCRRTFGATGVYSSTNPKEVSFATRFDLVWVGSVFTHIDKMAWAGWLTTLAAALTDDGLLVLTTEGPPVAQKLEQGHLPLGLEPEAVQSILHDYAQSGFGFADYPALERHDIPRCAAYGIAVVHPDEARRMVRAAGLEVMHYIDHGWDNHQDVFACRRFSAAGAG